MKKEINKKNRLVKISEFPTSFVAFPFSKDTATITLFHTYDETNNTSYYHINDELVEFSKKYEGLTTKQRNIYMGYHIIPNRGNAALYSFLAASYPLELALENHKHSIFEKMLNISFKNRRYEISTCYPNTVSPIRKQQITALDYDSKLDLLFEGVMSPQTKVDRLLRKLRKYQSQDHPHE